MYTYIHFIHISLSIYIYTHIHVSPSLSIYIYIYIYTQLVLWHEQARAVFRRARAAVGLLPTRLHDCAARVTILVPGAPSGLRITRALLTSPGDPKGGLVKGGLAICGFPQCCPKTLGSVETFPCS